MRGPRLLEYLRRHDLLGWILLAILAARAAFFIVYSVRTILFPFPVDYDEGVILHSTLLLAHGEAVYRPLQSGEFVSSAYTPLYYLLTAPFLRLAGPTLVPGRLIALLATAGSAALLAGLARQLGTSRRGALAAALLPLALGTTVIWSTLAKPDTLALFLALLVLYWIVRFGASRWVYLAALWFALGFFAKQNTILVTGPVLLYLFLRRPRRGLVVGLLALLLTAGLFFLVNALTGGAFYLHTLGFHGLPWQAAQLRTTVEPLLVFLPGLTLLTLLAAWRQARHRMWPPLVLLGSGVLFLLTGGRIGTNWSFQLPLLFAMALSVSLLLFPRDPALPAGVAHPSPQAAQRAPGARTAPLPALPTRWPSLLLVIAILQFVLLINPLRWYRPDLLASAARQQALEAVCTLIARTPPPILSEDVGMLLLCGHTPRYDDPFMMAQLSRAGRWDETELVRQIEEQEFSLVILAYDLTALPPERTQVLRWTPGPFAALRQHYVLWQEKGQLFLYHPRAATASCAATGAAVPPAPGERGDLAWGLKDLARSPCRAVRQGHEVRP